MNSKYIPGFTAGASLYPTIGRYRTPSESTSPSGAVAPQMTAAEMNEFMRSLLHGPGVVPPWWLPWPLWSGGDGGDGTGGGGIDLACGKCRSACLRKPTSQRAACLAICDDSVC